MTTPARPLSLDAYQAAAHGLTIHFKRLRPEAVLPTKAHPGDAAFDLHVHQSGCIEPGCGMRIPTGLAWECPAGWYAQILTRSSHANRGLFVAGGVIDAGYRGEWFVVLNNNGPATRCIDSGDRIAQFVILPVPQCQVVEVEELGQTARGEGGFGSSGR